MNRLSRVSCLDLTAMSLHDDNCRGQHDGHPFDDTGSSSRGMLMPSTLSSPGLSRRPGWGSTETRQAYSSLTSLNKSELDHRSSSIPLSSSLTSSSSSSSCYQPHAPHHPQFGASPLSCHSPELRNDPDTAIMMMDDDDDVDHRYHHDEGNDNWGFFVDVRGHSDAAASSPFATWGR